MVDRARRTLLILIGLALPARSSCWCIPGGRISVSHRAPRVHRHFRSSLSHTAAGNVNDEEISGEEPSGDASSPDASSGGLLPPPLFPELTETEPPEPPSYDAAADALLAASPSAPADGTRTVGGFGVAAGRPLSTSDILRDAVLGGDLDGAADLLKRTLGPGGGWHENGDDNEGSSDEGREEEEVDQVDETDSPPENGLTNLDYLLGRIIDNDSRTT